MARLQIPLDALTSRLNLSDRFAGVRAQSLTSRFSNLRPISEFLDIKRVSKPANFSEVQSRVNYNLSYFSSNYAAVFIMLSIYSLLTNLILLFVILLAIGGSYGIGRLEGRDLEVAGFRATTSQLYTTSLGFPTINCALAHWGDWSDCFGPRFVYGQTNRECFFRGGGLDGRPRTPYDSPLWGRPSGARVGRSKKEGWPEQLEESVRIEQLGIDDYDDDEDDENEGVLLGPPFDPGRFHNSNMRPMCPGTYPGVRRKGNNYDFDDDEVCGEEYSSGDDDQSEHGLVGEDPNSTMAYAMQLARRDQQAMLVERALGKIRRAQMQGQTKVMLSQRELDALEKKRQQDSKVNGSKPKDSSGQPVIENKPIASDKRIPGGYASSTGSPRFRSPTVEPSSPSSQKPRSRAPSIKSSRMSHHMDASPRNQHPPMYPQPLPYFVPQEPTVRPGSSSYQSNPRSGSSSNNHSAYPPHHHPSPYYTYPLPATDTRYGYSTHTHRSAPPPHIDATYQPIYRAMSGDSYMINHSSSDPFIVQHASRLCESPRSMRRSSGSSSSGDNGVHNISVAESPSVPVGSEKKVSSGSGSGHGRIRRRKRRH
ncbi:COPII vesicles protein Yip3 [Blastomyces dermatitidis ATCC 18188]|uniref:COPII vesicles protein Yip3 n=1 Tax=Ajellomyces dermatitidis (strain ATCC 18188 / CBS 674.68) TaxID=653446 RepID=F2T2P7_AJEDA|nr:COPII vesicles protein Yip3 [Blastomyces dermatitidis ATCC 18188]